MIAFPACERFHSALFFGCDAGWKALEEAWRESIPCQFLKVLANLMLMKRSDRQREIKTWYR